MTGRKHDGRKERQQDYITKKLFERHHGATKSLILKPLNHKVVDRGIEPLWTQKNGADNRLIFYFRFIKLELFL